MIRAITLLQSHFIAFFVHFLLCRSHYLLQKSLISLQSIFHRTDDASSVSRNVFVLSLILFDLADKFNILTIN